ncbi:hypothetical protein [Flavobacterium sp.]|uniref:hypothetical protein n=1 Tax=Flavobacterium sp. TaxID=239 RepID=UPI003D121312
MKKAYYLYLAGGILILASFIKKMSGMPTHFEIFNFETNVYLYTAWKVFLSGYLFYQFYIKLKQDSTN